MIPDFKLWQFSLERINKSQTIILLCVVESKGSSPGRQGFKMAVASDDFYGSIGGGIMEHKFVEMAKEKLLSIGNDPVLRKQIHNKSASKNQSGMICSGEQTIVLFQLTNLYSEVISQISTCLENSGNGRLKLSPDKISFSKNDSGPDYFFEMNSEDDWQYQETLGYKNHLYIIGGGHCALAFSKLMSSMDFFIHLFEERNGLNTYEQNKFVNEKNIISDYSELKNIIPSDNKNYIVVMTFGYRTDDIALRALIEKDFKYLGVLGSQSKMEKMFEEWRKDNLPEDKLKKINAPVGIHINSQTPEEIAISIAAEIINIKNQK